MAVTNSERVQQAIELVARWPRFVRRSADEQSVRRRTGRRRSRERPKTNAKKDAQFLLRTMIKNWNEVFAETLGHSERSWVSELLTIRNRWAHNEQFTSIRPIGLSTLLIS